MTVSFSACALVRPPPETKTRSSVKLPAAATKPLPMLTATVPDTLRSVLPVRSKLKLPPPSIVSALQFRGVGVTPPVASFTLTSKLEM